MPGGRRRSRFQHGRRVREQRRDPVALLQADVAERVGEAPRPLAERRVCVATLAVHERDLVRIDERGAFEQVDRIQLGAGDLFATRQYPL
jgi:hypothetical protein